jgi:hypothetical protein
VSPDAPHDIDIVDGVFVAAPLPCGDLFQRVRQRVSGHDWPAGVSLYLRGSAVERRHPHPGADLDLVIVGAVQPAAVIGELRTLLAPERRLVDVVALSPESLRDDLCHRLLLTTRARLVAGPEVPVEPVAADDRVAWAFWRRYAVFLVSQRNGGSVQRRVTELKQLTRAFGVFRWLRAHRFTRDVGTCLDWTRREAPAAAAVLDAGWRELERTGETEPTGPLDIEPVRDALVELLRTHHP